MVLTHAISDLHLALCGTNAETTSVLPGLSLTPGVPRDLAATDGSTANGTISAQKEAGANLPRDLWDCCQANLPARRLRRRSASLLTASRPFRTYSRGSRFLGWRTSCSRNAAVKIEFRWVEMLTLVIPARTAREVLVRDA